MYSPALRLVRNPLYAILIPFPVVCFVATLATDMAYWRSAEMMWANFSAWLLAIGMATGGLALIAGLFDLLVKRAIRSSGRAWLQFIGGVVVLALALLNSLVHSRDAWTSVVPQGLVLSAATVLVLLITASLSRAIVYRPIVEGVE